MKNLFRISGVILLIFSIFLIHSCKKDKSSTVPGAPTIGTATAGNAQATVIFTAPVSDGGSAITGYTVTSNPGSITATGTASPITVTGLTNGTAYAFTVTATNAIGTSVASSASNSVTPTAPFTVPGAPTIGTATAGNAQATVIFTAPVSNGGSAITGYTVTSNPGNITGTGTASPITVTELTNGTAYTFTVTATNVIGTSVASSASNSVTPVTVPGAPTIGTATAGNAQATITFTAPVSNGGSAITGYTVTSSPGSKTGTGTASPITLTGLTNGTSYTFTVTATNTIGNSVASSTSNSVTPSVPSTVPGAPTIGTATAGNAQATVIFTAPVSNGGSAITGYTVTSSPGGLTAAGSASTITVSGLTNGTAYTFTVTATNVIGTSLASVASNSVTPTAPSTVPGAPTIGTAIAGNAQATVTFTAPVSDGGSAITGYTVTSNPDGLTGAGTASPITVSGLTNGTAYTFTVTATNAIGNSVASSASNSVTPVAPSTVPGAPTIGTASAGNAQATVIFTAPVSDGGSAITGYTVTSVPDGLTGTGTASPITVSGLTNGTAYTFTVTATNAIGNSAASSATNSVTPVVPTTVPGAPTIGTATAGTAQAVITFTAPVSDGGSAITGYTVTSSPDGLTGAGTASPITVAGLTNGTAYTFTVTATNAIGTGVASSASNSGTPLAPITDNDGNVYNNVTIGTQVWMAENLKTTKYNDGTAIPNIIDNISWANATTGAYSDYSNTPANSTTHGRLYNWYAVDATSNGGKNVCPTSWHVSTDAEWTTLTTYLGGAAVAGVKLKETGTTHWLSFYTVATNETGFTALPGGNRDVNGAYHNIGDDVYWWSSTESSTPNAWFWHMTGYSDNVERSYNDKRTGFSVRCVRDF
jgi:trimeric autotransporter adhesin